MAAETTPTRPDAPTKVDALTHDELLDRIDATGKAKFYMAALRKMLRTSETLEKLRTVLGNARDELGELEAQTQDRLKKEAATQELEMRKAAERTRILAEDGASQMRKIVKPTIADPHFVNRISNSDTLSDSGVRQLKP